jgi:hypothetical protein
VAARLIGRMLLKSDITLSLPTGQPARNAMLLPVVA